MLGSTYTGLPTISSCLIGDMALPFGEYAGTVIDAFGHVRLRFLLSPLPQAGRLLLLICLGNYILF